MIKLAAAGFVTAISVMALTVSPALADRPAVPSGTPTLKLASQLGPSRGGASGLSRGYVPLHAREYALAKAGVEREGRCGERERTSQAEAGCRRTDDLQPSECRSEL